MRATSAVVFLVFATLACNRSGTPAPQAAPPVSAPAPAGLPARIDAIELGTAVGEDGRVTAPGAVFSPADTIYVSILTQNPAPGSTVSARWSYEDGQVVSEGREALVGSGPTVSEFHIAKPDGWPAGRYRVEIALNGQAAGARDFEVR